MMGNFLPLCILVFSLDDSSVSHVCKDSILQYLKLENIDNIIHILEKFVF